MATDLEEEELAELSTRVGSKRTVLRVALPGRDLSLVNVMKNGAYCNLLLNPNQFDLYAPKAKTRLDDEVVKGNWRQRYWQDIDAFLKVLRRHTARPMEHPPKTERDGMTTDTRRFRALQERAARGKYKRLFMTLLVRRSGEWRTTIGEVESLLGFDLPPSARRHRRWWENNESHSQATGMDRRRMGDFGGRRGGRDTRVHTRRLASGGQVSVRPQRRAPRTPHQAADE